MSNPEEKLEFKMIRTKNKILTNEIKLGRIESHEEPVEMHKRPILTELWSIFYKKVPSDQRESYEQFFNRMQGVVDETIKDISESLSKRPARDAKQNMNQYISDLSSQEG